VPLPPIFCSCILLFSSILILPFLSTLPLLVGCAACELSRPPLKSLQIIVSPRFSYSIESAPSLSSNARSSFLYYLDATRLSGYPAPPSLLKWPRQLLVIPLHEVTQQRFLHSFTFSPLSYILIISPAPFIDVPLPKFFPQLRPRPRHRSER
jgi:hypothetical protein